jgi:predicted flavoprotein YhiN
MLKACPGVFVRANGWTGKRRGRLYLLQACFATGAAAAWGVLERLGY